MPLPHLMNLSTGAINNVDESQRCDWVTATFPTRKHAGNIAWRARTRGPQRHRIVSNKPVIMKANAIAKFHGPRLAIHVSALGTSYPVAPSWNTNSHASPISIRPMKSATNHTLDGPDFTLTGVRLTGRTVKSFFLRTLDFGMGSSPAAGAMRLSQPSDCTGSTDDERGCTRDHPGHGLARRRTGGMRAGGRSARHHLWRVRGDRHSPQRLAAAGGSRPRGTTVRRPAQRPARRPGRASR